MQSKILCVGKLKEKYLQLGIEEYLKRMNRFGGLTISEIADQPVPDGASAIELEQIRNIEGRNLLKKLKDEDYVITLEINGKLLTSEQLAHEISEQKIYNRGGDIVFVIGGSVGLSHSVSKRANLKISFGHFTLPHQLMRLVLTEQIYRANMINANATYHK